MDNTDDQISQEGFSEEVTVIEAASDASSATDQSTVLVNLEELIRNHIENLEKNRQEVRQQQEMFKDSFENDPVYRENDEKVKEATKVKSTTRENILKQPQMQALAQKIKDLKMGMRESQTALSDYLQEYQRLTGATTIETRDGQILEIVNTSKLKKAV